MSHKTSKLLFILGIAYIALFFGIGLGGVGSIPDPDPSTSFDAVLVALIVTVPFVLGYYGHTQRSG